MQVLSGEGWNEVMYSTSAATSQGAVTYFLVIMILGRFVLLNLFLAVLLDSFSAEGGSTALMGEEGESSTLTSLSEGPSYRDSTRRLPSPPPVIHATSQRSMQLPRGGNAPTEIELTNVSRRTSVCGAAFCVCLYVREGAVGRL